MSKSMESACGVKIDLNGRLPVSFPDIHTRRLFGILWERRHGEATLMLEPYNLWCMK